MDEYKPKTTITLPLMVPLFIVLFLLKITGYTSISWLLVTAPLWFPITAMISIILLVSSLLILHSYFDPRNKRDFL